MNYNALFDGNVIAYRCLIPKIIYLIPIVNGVPGYVWKQNIYTVGTG